MIEEGCQKLVQTAELPCARVTLRILKSTTLIRLFSLIPIINRLTLMFEEG